MSASALAAAPALDAGEIVDSAAAGGPPETDGTAEQERKLFLGGLSWETTDQGLRDHFGQHGELTDVVIMKDKMTGKSRGFGFVTYAKRADAVTAVAASHLLDGKNVEAKHAQSREAMGGRAPGGGGGGGGGGGAGRSKKVFVGGLDPGTTEQEFRTAFEKFGEVTEIVIMKEGSTGKPRGFGFCTFVEEASASACVQQERVELHSRDVQVKSAVPRDQMAPPRRGHGGGYGGGGGGYGGGGGESSRSDCPVARAAHSSAATVAGYGGGYGGGQGQWQGGGGQGQWQGGGGYGGYQNGPPRWDDGESLRAKVWVWFVWRILTRLHSRPRRRIRWPRRRRLRGRLRGRLR